jgi:hypothetical protein
MITEPTAQYSFQKTEIISLQNPKFSRLRYKFDESHEFEIIRSSSVSKFAEPNSVILSSTDVLQKFTGEENCILKLRFSKVTGRSKIRRISIKTRNLIATLRKPSSCLSK